VGIYSGCAWFEPLEGHRLKVFVVFPQLVQYLGNVQRVFWLLSFGAEFVLSSSLLPRNIKIHRSIILPVLYGYETWSLTMMDEHRLRVLENRVLRKIFGPKRDQVTEWRRLHSEELHDLYFSLNIIRVIKSRRMRWVQHAARMGDCSYIQWFDGET
jgi:hypothetical protein